MDVAKAKRVVIVLLLAFNIFLLINNLIYHDSQSVSRDTLENAETILEQRGVTLECPIPSKPGGSYKLAYIKGELDRRNIAVRLLGEEFEMSKDGFTYSGIGQKAEFIGSSRFTYTTEASGADKGFSNEKEAGEAALDFMKGKGLLDGTYILDGSVENNDGSWTLSYIETYRGSLLFDNCFSITIKGNYISRLEYQKQQIKGFSNESIDQPEAYQALLARFKEGSGIVITGIDNGYKLDEPKMEEMESVELLPVWRVKVKGASEPVYIRLHDS